jgi:hypothetical protein
MFLFFIKQFWTCIKELIYLGAAAGGVVAAFQGLSTWKKQLKGRAEYDAARKLFKATLQLRDAISYVRNPWIPIAETIAAEEQFKKENPDKEIKNSAPFVYKIRWNKIVEALSALQLESLEAEVFWGEDVQKIQKPIRQCVNKLNVTLSHFFDPQVSRTEKQDTIIYEINTDAEKDDFTKEIEQAVQKVADFLKPKIKF